MSHPQPQHGGSSSFEKTVLNEAEQADGKTVVTVDDVDQLSRSTPTLSAAQDASPTDDVGCKAYREEATVTTMDSDRLGNAKDHAVAVESVPAETFETSRMRFLVVTVFSVFGFVNQVQYTAYATIVRETQEKFGVSALQVNLLSLLIPVVYCLGVVPGCWFYNKVGLRYGMIAGAATNALASLLKLIAVWAPKYPLVVVAQILVAVGQILFLSLPPLIAARWFPVPERTVATAVSTLFGFFGMAVGMFYSPRVVYLPSNSTNKEWGALMGSQFALSVLVLAAMLLLVPERPAKRPSLTASQENADTDLWAKLRRQFLSRNLMLLTVAFGLPVGFLTAVAAVLTQILEPFDITEKNAGVLAFAGIMAGSANCAVVGFIVDRFRRYKVAMLVLVAVITAGLLLPIVCLMKTMTDNSRFAVAAYVIIPLLEFLLLPIVPVTMELSVELTYPDPETVSSTLVLMSMCFFSFVGMIIFSVILGDYPTRDTSFVVVLIALIATAAGFVALCFVKENRRRFFSEQPMQAVEKDGESGSIATPF